jgi:hypothetical protein
MGDKKRTSIISFGEGDVIRVDDPRQELAALLQDGIANHKLLDLQVSNGKTLTINPQQFKVLYYT